MTLASYVVFFPVLLYFVHVMYIAFDSEAYIYDSRGLSYLIWTAVPAVRTDYWTDLNIFLLKVLSDEIVGSR